jgi:hypothetical protein
LGPILDGEGLVARDGGERVYEIVHHVPRGYGVIGEVGIPSLDDEGVTDGLVNAPSLGSGELSELVLKDPHGGTQATPEPTLRPIVEESVGLRAIDPREDIVEGSKGTRGLATSLLDGEGDYDGLLHVRVTEFAVSIEDTIVSELLATIGGLIAGEDEEPARALRGCSGVRDSGVEEDVTARAALTNVHPAEELRVDTEDSVGLEGNARAYGGCETVLAVFEVTVCGD